MVALLEFLFQGFFEWVYGLILDIWNYFSSSLLNVMSLDFAYIKTHIPVMGDIQQIILAVGWALLLGNLVFQALRSMAAGLGFEGEDPKLLFARTFVFGFLLLASPQICEIVLGITSKVIALLDVPDAIHVQLVDGSVFGVFTASWLLVIIFDLITMFMVFSLLLEVAERYMVLAMLTFMAPLAFAMGGSKSTSEIFSGWCRMFGSMCFLMATNIVFFKMLLSVVSTVPSFPDVFLWMVLIVSIVKVAKKADEIITRIGLNPAITGGKSTLPGIIAYTVFRTALSMVTKGAANGIGGALGLTGKAAAGVGKSAGIGKGAAGRAFKGAGKGFGAAAGAVGGIGGAAAQVAGGPRYGGGRTQTSQTDTRQEQQSNTRQEQNRHTSQQNTSQTQTNGQRQTARRERTSGGQRTGPGGTFRPDRSSRKTSVQPGTRRGSSYVTPPDSQSKTEGKSTSSSGFTGFHGPQGGGFTGGRGGGFSKDTPRGGGFTGEGTPRGGGFSKDTPKGGGFTGEGTPRSGGFGGSSSDTHSGFGGAGAKTDTPRGGGTFGGRPSGTPRGAGFGGTFSKTSQKMEISQSGAAGTGTPPTSGKPGMGTSGSQPGAAGMGTRSTQRPPATEPRHSRDVPPLPATPTSGAQSSSPVQQEQRRGPGKDRPPAKGGGSAFHPGTAGMVKPPATKLSSGSMPGSQPGTAGTRSTRRPPASEPQHSRNVPPVTAASPSGAQSSSPAQQEQRRASKKDKLPVKSGGSVPRPGMAGTAPGSRTPPGQKLGGGPSKQKPTRQTKREGGPTSV